LVDKLGGPLCFGDKPLNAIGIQGALRDSFWNQPFPLDARSMAMGKSLKLLGGFESFLKDGRAKD